MNISTGGPHILFFERDQQLTALLLSEFGLAGYECHTARTAVEVFDAIARFSIRIVLVDLAQAAAGRREFWIALDTQRRGRGVQVLTFRCTNLAGYGPKYADERSQIMPPDIEVDGMLGLMNLVEMVRERVPGSGISSSTITVPRIPKIAPPSPSPQPALQGSTNGTSQLGSASNGQGNAAARAESSVQSAPSAVSSSSSNGATARNQQSYSEKIRAVLYPNQRPISPPDRSVQSTQSAPSTQDSSTSASTYDTQNRASLQNGSLSYDPDATVLQRLASGQTGTDGPKGAREQRESGLAQLSRMVQGSQETRTRSTLRASPIEDLPVDRAGGGQMTGEGARRSDAVVRTGYSPYEYASQGSQISSATTPLASISMSPTASASQAIAQQTVSTPAGTSATADPAFQPAVSTTVEEHANQGARNGTENVSGYVEDEEVHNELNTAPIPIEQVQQTQQVQAAMQNALREDVKTNMSPNNAMLLDIVQSLPLMPSPPSAPPQPSTTQAVSGRPIRSLGSVLLEGHLVQQNRLEVAQNIQRMLRGVDLNYQLGEILLMFKLLTPDQLLAASLVSYGMISTQQISALGRIRQELHSIGLEYDLESLLILFRMLTPEQLREVRTSWQS